MIAYTNYQSGPSLTNQQILKRYAYEGNNRINLQFIYTLSVQPNK